jgi:hypothetical protein
VRWATRVGARHDPYKAVAPVCTYLNGIGGPPPSENALFVSLAFKVDLHTHAPLRQVVYSLLNCAILILLAARSHFHNCSLSVSRLERIIDMIASHVTTDLRVM